jgi:HEAT repeat protein
MYAAADPQASVVAFDVLATFLDQRWRGLLDSDALSHRTARDRWRRVTALRILFRLDRPTVLPLLSRAVDEADETVAEAGLALLAQSDDERAMDILIAALKRQQHPASRIASHIEASPQPIAARLKEMLSDPDPVVRLWGATLLARYPDEPMEEALAALTDDADPRVRKAALQTLGGVGGDLTAACAARLLADPVAYVRAHAARCLAELGRSELAEPVAKLLGDRDWWTRLAARESLEMMGSDVWPIAMRCLGSDDAFVRNGAAEVIQNIGVLDSLIVMEAASDSPGEAKIAMLRNIAQAGGVRFTDSLVDRSGPIVGARIRSLLSTIGLERVEAL